jgi:hypothetical protein
MDGPGRLCGPPLFGPSLLGLYWVHLYWDRFCWDRLCYCCFAVVDRHLFEHHYLRLCYPPTTAMKKKNYREKRHKVRFKLLEYATSRLSPFTTHPHRARGSLLASVGIVVRTHPG